MGSEWEKQQLEVQGGWDVAMGLGVPTGWLHLDTCEFGCALFKADWQGPEKVIGGILC